MTERRNSRHLRRTTAPNPSSLRPDQTTRFPRTSNDSDEKDISTSPCDQCPGNYVECANYANRRERGQFKKTRGMRRMWYVRFTLFPSFVDSVLCQPIYDSDQLPHRIIMVFRNEEAQMYRRAAFVCALRARRAPVCLLATKNHGQTQEKTTRQ
jgi:hypothetical protein